MHYKLEQLKPHLRPDEQFPEIWAPPEGSIIMAEVTVKGQDHPFIGRVAQVEFNDEEGPIVVVDADTDGYDIHVERGGLDHVKFIIHEVVLIIG